MTFLFLLLALLAPDPFAGETLHYSVNWPSGLSLGESNLEAKQVGERWEFFFSLDAALPGVAVTDRFRSLAGAGLGSLEFEKRFTNGKRKAAERTTFDPQAATATRETLDGGGRTEMKTPAGAKDALAFLYFLRRELSQGRLPAPQTVYFGAPYQVRLEYGGLQSVRVNDARMDADRIAATVKGPSSEITFDLFFARDAARTLLVARVPFPMGVFTMELVR